MTPTAARRTLAQSVLANAGAAYLLGFAIAALGGAIALLGRPEAAAAGPSFVAATLLASVGTSMTAIALAAPAVAANATRVRWERSGARAGLAQLGVGERDLVRALLPSFAVLGLAGGALVWLSEPPAWTAIHGLKGSPAATAAVLGRLAADETLSAGAGDLVLASEGDRVQVWGRAGWTATAASLRPAARGWQIERLEVRSGTDTWGAGQLRLHLIEPPEPPTSPLARGLGDLLGDETPRARLVLHRRLALPLLAVVLGLMGWLAGGTRAGIGPAARLAALILGTVLALRGADLAAARGILGAGTAGWLPAAAACVLLLALLRRRP